MTIYQITTLFLMVAQWVWLIARLRGWQGIYLWQVLLASALTVAFISLTVGIKL